MVRFEAWRCATGQRLRPIFLVFENRRSETRDRHESGGVQYSGILLQRGDRLRGVGRHCVTDTTHDPGV